MASSITFAGAIADAFKKYAAFRGTATRAQFWYFELFRFLVLIVCSVLDSVFGKYLGQTFTDISPISLIANIALFLPSLALMARRFRDAGFSAHWLWGQLAVTIALVYYLVSVLGNQAFSALYNSSVEVSQEMVDVALASIPIGSWVGLAVSVVVAAAYSIFCLVIELLPSKNQQQNSADFAA